MCVNTALIGFGLSGKKLVSPFLSANNRFCLHTICTQTNKESLTLYPDSQLTHDYTEVLNNSSIDLVFITTPNIFHFPMAMQALQAGKHVVIEKPFTPTYREALELIKESRKQKRILSVYHNRRWDSCFLTAKAVIEQGLSGDTVLFEAFWNRYTPVLSENWWRDEALPGGGVLYDLGSHLLDQAVQLFGKPESLFADIRNQRKGAVVDDYFDVLLYYHNKKVRISSGALFKNHSLRYAVHGTKGSYIKHGIDPQGELLIKGIKPGVENWGMEAPEDYGRITADINGLTFEGSVESLQGNWMCFYENLADVIIKRHELIVKPEEAAYTIYLIEKCFESNKKQARISCKEG